MNDHEVEQLAKDIAAAINAEDTKRYIELNKKMNTLARGQLLTLRARVHQIAEETHREANK